MASEGGGGVGAVLLAAGASRRMGGVDKVWAELGGAAAAGLAVGAAGRGAGG